MKEKILRIARDSEKLNVYGVPIDLHQWLNEKLSLVISKTPQIKRATESESQNPHLG